ncbi:MAG TPA: glycosyltransferase family 39 protein [Tepidisphaeraceae bacterium]|jgi:hypothetical protein
MRWLYALKKLLPLVIPAIFFVLVLRAGRDANAFQYDTDEGLNLMKASLVQHGHALFKEIWSDQPPVLTVLLAWWFKAFGATVLSARILILVLATVLLASLAQTVRKYEGTLAGILVAAFVVCSLNFIKLSFSVMVGLPALAFAMMALFFIACWRDSNRWIYLLLAGAFMAISLQTKLFTGTVIPVLVLGCFVPTRKQRDDALAARQEAEGLLARGGGAAGENVVGASLANPTAGIMPPPIQLDYANPLEARRLGWMYRILETSLRNSLAVFLWLGAGAAAYFLISFAFHVDYHQLLDPHMKWRDGPINPMCTFQSLYPQILNHDLYLELPALVYFVMFLLQFRPARLLPLVWLATSAYSLYEHNPVWYHHCVLLTIPFCWMAAIGVSAMVKYLVRTAEMGAPRLLRHSFSFRHLPGPVYGAFALAIAVIAIFGAGPVQLAFLTAAVGWSLFAMLRHRTSGERASVPWVKAALTAGIAIALLYPLYDPVLGGFEDSQQSLRSRPASEEDLALIKSLCSREKQTKWIFCDLPIYAFRANMLAPPELAVISEKRRVMGFLPDEEIVDLLKHYKPEQILLMRFNYGWKVHSYIDANYSQVNYYQRHYVLRNLPPADSRTAMRGG